MDGSTKWRELWQLKHIKNPAKSAGGHGGNLTRLTHWPRGEVAKTQDHEFVDNEYFNTEAQTAVRALEADEEEQYRRG